MNRLIVTLCLLLLSTSSFASEDMLKRFFSDVTTLQANFMQSVTDESGMTLQTKSGVFSFSRPGKFRWNYNSQDPDIALGEQIISDSMTITFYDPDLETAQLRSMSNAVEQVPTLMLVQSGENLERFFNVTDFGKTDGLTWVALKPKDENAGYQELMIGFSGENLNTIALTDGLGNETRLRLNNIRTNTVLSKRLFAFSAPEGVDIIQQ